MDKNSPEYRKFIANEFFRIFGLIEFGPHLMIEDLSVESGDATFGKNELGFYTPEIVDLSANFRLYLGFIKEKGTLS